MIDVNLLGLLRPWYTVLNLFHYMFFGGVLGHDNQLVYNSSQQLVQRCSSSRAWVSKLNRNNQKVPHVFSCCWANL